MLTVKALSKKAKGFLRANGRERPQRKGGCLNFPLVISRPLSQPPLPKEYFLIHPPTHPQKLWITSMMIDQGGRPERMLLAPLRQLIQYLLFAGAAFLELRRQEDLFRHLHLHRRLKFSRPY